MFKYFILTLISLCNCLSFVVENDKPVKLDLHKENFYIIANSYKCNVSDYLLFGVFTYYKNNFELIYSQSVHNTSTKWEKLPRPTSVTKNSKKFDSLEVKIYENLKPISCEIEINII